MLNLPRLNTNGPIYLDNAATTPIDPAVLATMAPYLAAEFGNPSNPSHEFGVAASDAIETARRQIANLISSRPDEIIFTSGATESNNLAVLGIARAARAGGDHVITTRVEHKSVLAPCGQLEREGFRVTYLPVDGFGRVNPDDVLRAITPVTVLVSVMLANNEVGTLQPVADIGQHCVESGVRFHSDAVQALGKTPVDVDELGVDLLSVSAHKTYGPKGAGALYVRRRQSPVLIEPLCYGGGQERGLRPGTPAVPNIVGFGAACELSAERMAYEPARVAGLRDRLRMLIAEVVPEARFNGHSGHCLPGLLSVSFPGLDGEALSYAMGSVAVGRGSSCSSGAPEPSHVLTAMGVGYEQAVGTLRFSIGRFNMASDIDLAAELLRQAVASLHPRG